MSCCRCGSLDESKLYVTIGGRSYCADSWHDVGCPWPRDAASPEQIQAAEQATRERMLARGGMDRHLVRKGLT